MHIIATTGPSVNEKSVLKGIINAGADCIRFNFSHGSKEEFSKVLEEVRGIDKDIVILCDLSGTKIRVSNNFEYIYRIYDNEHIYFCSEDDYLELKSNLKKNKLVPLNISSNILDIKIGESISIKDNTMRFIVKDKVGKMLKVKTISGGIVRKGKGCNIPNINRIGKDMSEADRQAIIWAINNRVQIICQSYVEERKNIDDIVKVIKENNEDKSYTPKIFAKIESEQGIKNIDQIINVVDGIIVGRGDLIPETTIEDTPIYEEYIINKIKRSNKICDIIIATHILNSMREGKKPLISEVESIYTFINQGVNGFLLSSETSVGKAPIRSVEFLKSLIDKYQKKN